jgi:hypothetical protein
MNGIEKNFGIVIAFLLPGFILLWAVSLSSDSVAVFLRTYSSNNGATVGGFLYATLASLSLGLLISAIRWAAVDTVLNWHLKGPPNLNFESLKDEHTHAGFISIIENHYRYYQYYSNTLIALIVGAAVGLSKHGWSYDLRWAGLLVVAIALLLGARDALRKFYDRAEQILGLRQ